MKFNLLLCMLFWISGLCAQTSKAFKKSTCDYRKEYKNKFIKNERSPFYQDKKGTKKMKFFKPNANYQVNCTFERTLDEKPFEMPTYSGMLKPYVKYGILRFELQGKQQELAVYQNLRMRNLPPYKNHLFLPFKDLTSNESTYGGGRYIDLTIDAVSGDQILLDFNRAYNPWCAYSDGYNCPIPPKENHLELAIEAGEKQYGGKVKHKAQ